MSKTRNILNILDQFSDSFIDKFDFYLDSLDELFNYQSQIGLEENELSQLPEQEQNLIKTYLFLVESSNTTTAGALRLLSSNIFSDAYSLIRINYEIGCILHYGNISRDNKIELYNTFFKANEQENKQGIIEYKFIKKAEKQFEKEKPGFIPIRKELNNFGSHISKKKVVIGNVKLINDSSASSVFMSNFNNRYFLACLEFIYFTCLMILEEYTINCESYIDIDHDTKNEINMLTEKFIKNIRPKLQSSIHLTEL